jgi:hypothetical protein
MEGPHAAHSRAHRERLKREQQFARQIMFVADQAFAERTEIPSVSDLRPPEARHGDQAEDGSIRPLPWEYLFREAAE